MLEVEEVSNGSGHRPVSLRVIAGGSVLVRIAASEAV